MPRRRGTTARNRELRRQLSAQNCNSKFPRQVSVAADAGGRVGGGGAAEGHVQTSSQCQHLHPHQYPPAQHRSGASAHSDPDSQLLSFCFYGRQEYQSTPGISKQVLFQIRPGLKLFTGRLRILNRMFSRAACRHDLFLHCGWASLPNPGNCCWLFGCAPLKARHHQKGRQARTDSSFSILSYAIQISICLHPLPNDNLQHLRWLKKFSKLRDC